MNFHIMTIFPEMIDGVKHSIIKRAVDSKKVNIYTYDIRDFSEDKHKKVDAIPFGGGAGMVMTPDPIYNCYNHITKDLKNYKVVYMTPKGKTFNQRIVVEMANIENLIILCGHYEGIDQRVLDLIVDEEISIGDYVLTGGELGAMVLIDSISRYVDGVIKQDSLKDESFTNDLLEYPHFTRPRVWQGKEVPEVLLNGNHKKIDEYRLNESLRITKERRIDLYNKYKKDE